MARDLYVLSGRGARASRRPGMKTSPAGPPGNNPPNPPETLAQRLRGAAKIIVVSSVMFSFISYWRTAAVVLCDLASTAYYIGGIVEQSIGPAAPWFILE